MYAAHVDIGNRGSFFPLGVLSESAFKQQFAETGFWQKEEGTLLISAADTPLAGHIEFFKPVGYWDAFELSYQLYDQQFAGRGRVSEAVQLMADYLFAVKKQYRIQLDIVPENAASRRIAEKCGFQLEGTARGAFFNAGRNQDLLIYSLLRDDPRGEADYWADRLTDQSVESARSRSSPSRIRSSPNANSTSSSHRPSTPS